MVDKSSALDYFSHFLDSLPGELTDEENCYEHHATQQLPTESDLESFRSIVQAFQMLLLWEKENGKDATRNKLANALISIGRSDLSEKFLRGIAFLMKYSSVINEYYRHRHKYEYTAIFFPES